MSETENEQNVYEMYYFEQRRIIGFPTKNVSKSSF